MKILFAVSNENVSNKIVDSYQKRYGEAVSFKSVFYFNAIIREIHKDKTYDRIVISEDLEPFSNSNYDVIDKFILERFKEITNEINAQEKFIDIVVICTDRRTKSGYVLSKMYEYGVYNALVGADRRIDNVCSLLNSPRTAQEAKEYYGLENQVDTSSVDDVSEQEVQNILIHYKKLGRNEDRYVDSFNNIAAQYTDKQLKIIIKCLPINVRAVLEAECPKYQELVTYAEETEEERKQKEKIQEQKRLEQLENERKLKQKIERDKREAAQMQQREYQQQNYQTQASQMPSGIDLLDNKRREQRMTGNVIIPDNMNIRNERKVYSDEEINAMNNRQSQRQVTPMQQSASTLPGLDDLDNIPQARPTQQPASTLPGLDDLDNIPQARPVQQQPASTLPGLDDLDNIPQARPVQQPASTLPGLDDFNNIPQTRLVQHPANLIPDVNSESQMQMEAVTKQPEIPQEPKRGRGRPRKTPIEPPKPKGKRGRPRKNPLPEENNIEKEKIIPGVNDFENIPKVDKIQQTESTTQVENIRQPEGWNKIENLSEQTVNNSKKIDWNNDPFEGKTNQQIANTLPGINDWDNDSVGSSNNNQLAEQQNNLPSTNDWNRDPFEDSNNNSQPSQPSTLPGLDNFENIPQSRPVQPQQPSTLPGTNDWNRDPFENSNNNQQTQQPSTLPGTNDWDRDPFENSNNNQQTQQPSTLPGTNDWDRDPFEINKSDNSNDTITLSSSMVQPNMSQYQNNQNGYNKEEPKKEEAVSSYQPSKEKIETIKKIEEDKLYTTGSLNTVLTKDKKIVAFVGASKSGTSFLVNNLACLFSSIGIKTAILDMAQNKDSYYIYTNNDENLRNIAQTSIENLEKGIAEGIQIDRNLTVYTTLPHDGKDYSNAESILATLVQNTSLVLIDCDLETDLGYFANAQEIYLVQSMDILTIQPLTAFLRDLKAKGLLDQEKLRIVINKDIKVKGVTSKDIIRGMSVYNDPAMSYMTELFNKDKVKACSIPFDESIYTKYLEEVINCVISINRYNKNFMNSLKMLGNMVYPLLSKQTYAPRNSAEANYGNNFSSEMNDTLNQMKNKY